MALSPFLATIEQRLKQGNATEHTYRSALETLFQTVIAGCTATNEPKREAYGAPDFLIAKGNIPIGHVEAKDIGIDLGVAIADSERDVPKSANGKQLKRYRAALPNLLYTDGLQWHWFVEGNPRIEKPVCIATWDAVKGKLTRSKTAESDLTILLEQFAVQKTELIGTPHDLAHRLAQVARWLDEVITTALTKETTDGPLNQQLEAFRQTLLPTITPAEFADMYAQTLVYGLFAARVAVADTASFSRLDAAQAIPNTNPFLRKMFQQIAGFDLDERIAWLVDDCALLLEQTNMAEVLHDFGKATQQADPVVHFYETFLAAYDPKTRERRGVYYTPEPVVSYIVRSVDWVLQTHFARPSGLADHETIILDPATGTATFLHAVVQHIYATLTSEGLADTWNQYVPEQLLPRLFGFELLMAPYTIAHLKLSMLLQQLGYDFGREERLGIYLTNALADAPTGQHIMPFAQFLAEEGRGANAVKHTQPVMVVLGNPPYSYQSANSGAWINHLVRDYYMVEGQPLGERNPKGLQDDYVKFIRFAQWRIAQTGEGVVAFISNNGYLDNPTFRGMREQLLHEFDTIYLYNLHGNSRKKEQAPDGGSDENVFDIQQGVAIGIFLKQGSSNDDTTVYYADLWGKRGTKYTRLWESDVSKTDWQQLTPTSPWFLFVPYDDQCSRAYETGWKVPAILLEQSAGILTGRDRWFLSFDYQEAVQKAATQHIPSSAVVPLLYRPFDHRWIIYESALLERSRMNMMQHMLDKENLCLLFARSTSPNTPFTHIFCTPFGTIARSFADMACITHFSPLYLYPNGNGHADLFEHANGRRPNLSAACITAFEQRLGMTFIPDGTGDLDTTFGPEDLFHYLYAVLHSPTYRSRYADLLKRDYPHVPLPRDASVFKLLADYGAVLVDLHLLRLPSNTVRVGGAGGAAILVNPAEQGVTQQGTTSGAIAHVRYHAQQQRVLIDSDNYFAGIAPAVWEMQIGGYAPLQKWLKDRKGRTLGVEDVRHYMRMVVALRETGRLMQEIDEVVQEW